MELNFHFFFERDGEFYIGYCPEVPEANGQGYTLEECRHSLEEAIEELYHNNLLYLPHPVKWKQSLEWAPKA